MTQNNNQPKINYVPACLLTIFAIILDQWTKHLAVTKLQGKTLFHSDQQSISALLS